MDTGGDSVWQRGLDWVEGNRQGFVLPPGPPDMFRIKALGELAAVVEVLHRQADLDAGARNRLRRLLEFAWDEFGRGDVFVAILDQQPFPVLGTMYAVFDRLGWRHEPTRERLARLAQPGGLKAQASLPSESGPPVNARYGPDAVAVLCLGLGVAWEAMGLSSPWSPDLLYPRTSLGRGLPGTELTIHEAYSLTHTVFFMTDWGANVPRLPVAARTLLAERAGAWMEAFRLQEHFDLYAEVALALCCVDGRPAEAEGVLAAAQEEDGALRGDAARVAERTRGIEDPERRRFIAVYHTTLASMLTSFAVTVGLARGAGAGAGAARAEEG